MRTSFVSSSHRRKRRRPPASIKHYCLTHKKEKNFVKRCNKSRLKTFYEKFSRQLLRKRLGKSSLIPFFYTRPLIQLFQIQLISFFKGLMKNFWSRLGPWSYHTLLWKSIWNYRSLVFSWLTLTRCCISPNCQKKYCSVCVDRQKVSKQGDARPK